MFNITICSVSFGCKAYLDINWNLTDKLNRSSKFQWIVADNAIGSLQECMPANDERFKIVEGIPKNEKKANEHHAEAIMLLLKKVDTRYLLVLDPDFFIIRENWISNVISYMHEKNLGILGSQWHPSAYKKIRYFPSVHCLFVDLKKIDIDTFNVRPAHDSQDYSNRTISAILQKISISKRFDYEIMERFKIGTSRDTGCFLPEIISDNNRLKSECFTAVFENKNSWLSRVIDSLVPDRYSFTPKLFGYTSEKGFKDLGIDFCPNSKGWEEFLWNGKPFGFHVRRYPKRKRGKYSVDEDLMFIESALKKVLQSC